MIHEFLYNNFNNKRLVAPAEFLLKMAIVYALWRAFKYGGEHYENFLWGGWDAFKDAQGRLIGTLSAMQLRMMGYNVIHYDRIITVDGSAGIFVGDLCLGIAPMVIFTGFVVSFGNHTANKLWFVPLGMAVINAINAMRLTALVLVQVHAGQYFGFAHNNLYVYLTYGAIFLLLVWWMDRLAFKQEAP